MGSVAVRTSVGISSRSQTSLKNHNWPQLYAYLAREGGATVQGVMDDLKLAQGTAHSYVNRLVNAGVVEVADDGQPRQYAARAIDLTVTTAAGETLGRFYHDEYGVSVCNIRIGNLTEGKTSAWQTPQTRVSIITNIRTY